MSDYDEGYRAGMQIVLDLAHKRIEDLEAKLDEVEAERVAKLIKFHQLWRDACIRSGENSLRADAAEQRVATLEAALPAVHQLALEDAVNTLRTKRPHMHTTRHEMAQDIRATPTPTAAELMARIRTGEKE